MSESKVTTKQRQEAEKRLRNIVAKFKKQGIEDKDISRLFSFDAIAKKSSSKLTGAKSVLLLACLAIYGLVHVFYDDFNVDKCWIGMPNFVTKAARPPEECSMCQDVLEIKRVSNLTPDDFEMKYAYSAVPVVVTDATKSWKALEAFDFWFFKKLYTETELGKAARDCQFFPYKTEFKNIYDAFDMDDERANLTEGTKSWYFGWSNCHDNIAKILRMYYSRPYFLPASAENNPIDWIFMGGPGDGAQMHVDNVIHPSWQAQLKGLKRWYLAPPPECFYACKSIDVTMHPGEIIVVDTNRWYHKTEVLPGAISITIGAEYD